MAFWWALEPDQKLAVLTQNSSTNTSHSRAPPKMGRPPRSIPAKQTSEELAPSISVQNDPEPKAKIIGKHFFMFFFLFNSKSFTYSFLDSPPTMKENNGEVIDTNSLSEMMKNAMKKEGMTLKSFSKIFNVNRNYIATLINKPIPITETTPLQR